MMSSYEEDGLFLSVVPQLLKHAKSLEIQNDLALVVEDTTEMRFFIDRAGDLKNFTICNGHSTAMETLSNFELHFQDAKLKANTCQTRQRTT